MGLIENVNMSVLFEVSGEKFVRIFEVFHINTAFKTTSFRYNNTQNRAHLVGCVAKVVYVIQSISFHTHALKESVHGGKMHK